MSTLKIWSDNQFDLNCFNNVNIPMKVLILMIFLIENFSDVMTYPHQKMMIVQKTVSDDFFYGVTHGI